MRPHVHGTSLARSLRKPLLSLIGLGAALFSAGAFAAYANLVVDSVVQQIAGSVLTISGSGSSDNTTTWNYNTYARFILKESDTGEAFGLEVRPVGNSGAFQPNTDSLMIIQTVNSQGLTDTGSLSLYIRPSTDNEWSGTFSFSFYDSNFTTPARVNAEVTSLDLDYGQRMLLYRSELAGYGINAPTNVVVTEPSSDLIQFQGFNDAQISDPKAAVIALYDNALAFNAMFAHNRVALFMFEFRNPPSDLDDVADFEFTSTVPAPSTALLLAPALLLIPALRRRLALERDPRRQASRLALKYLLVTPLSGVTHLLALCAEGVGGASGRCIESGPPCVPGRGAPGDG